VRLDPSQSGLVFGDVLLDLGPPHAQHSSDLFGRRVLIEDIADLFESEAKVSQGE
jgi:hypothetical protein